MFLMVNTLLKSANDPKKVQRIVWISPNRELCYVMDIHRNSFPYMRQVADLEEGLESGTITIEETDPFLRIQEMESLSAKEKEIWEKGWQVIQLIAQNNHQPNIFIPSERAKLIKHAVATYGISEASVSKYLKRYWARGLNRIALLPDYIFCGGKGKDRSSPSGKKLGRPRKYTPVHGEMFIDDDVKRLFRIAIEKFYMTSKKPTKRFAYEQMLKEFFATDQKRIGNVTIPIIPEGAAIPSFSQFRYWFDKWRDIEKEISSREGHKVFQQQYRAVLGSTNQDAYGPGSVYQIDATVADIAIISEYDSAKILGRPTFYMVVDSYSRIITGIAVTLEAPSWQGAILALENACSSKVDWCRDQYGIEIQEDDWPCSGLPESILADRGELVSTKALSMIENLQIAVKNTPPMRPDWKPHVEKMFDLIQSHVKPFVPGATDKNIHQRAIKDGRVFAKLTLRDLTKILIKTILHYNNHHRLQGYERDELQITENVPAIPKHLWNFGMKYRSGRLRMVSKDILRYNLLPKTQASISPRGIRFNGMFYSCDTAIKESWFSRARESGIWKVDVSYDPRNVNQIYLRRSRTEYEVCYLLETQSRYKNKTLDDVRLLLDSESQENAEYTGVELGERISLAAEIESIVKESKLRTKHETKSISNAKKLKTIRENRKEEKERNRETESFVLEGVKAQSPIVNGSKKELEDDFVEEINHFSMLKKLQQEGMNGDH